MLFLQYGCSRMKLVLNICVVLCLMLLFLTFHFVAVIGGSLIGFNRFTWDQGIPVGVSVVAKLSPHGCTKEIIWSWIVLAPTWIWTMTEVPGKLPIHQWTARFHHQWVSAASIWGGTHLWGFYLRTLLWFICTHALDLWVHLSAWLSTQWVSLWSFQSLGFVIFL
jgi:hypothetical protein